MPINCNALCDGHAIALPILLIYMLTNKLYRFSLRLTANQYLRVYQGTAKRVSAITHDGQRIEFPAQNIQQFLTHDGISGKFEMELTPENKFVGIKRQSF